MKVDYIIPFVDMSDQVWFESYKKALGNESLNWGNSQLRYRDWGVFKYHLRSIEKNLNWVNNIYIILSGPSQIPDWLNTDNERIKIVYHKDIIPEEFLPTFNIGTIELFLQNIKGLSEHYIYSNDDFLIMNKLKEEDFFIDGLIVENIKRIQRTKLKKFETYTNWILNANKIVNPEYVTEDEKYYYCFYHDHGLYPNIKSENLRFFDEHESELLNSCTIFREKKNIPWLVYALNLYSKNKVFVKEKNIFLAFITLPAQIEKLELENYDVAIIEDESYSESKLFLKIMKDTVTKKLDLYFPEKSQFEK